VIDGMLAITPSACQAEFTYTMVLDVVKIQDTGKSEKSVADDELEPLLLLIGTEGSIAAYTMSFTDAQGS
jgi:hypothetical protein